MSTRLSLGDVTADTLKDADIIRAGDPKAPIYYKLLYGDGPPRPVPYGQPARVVSVVIIEFDSTQPDQLQRAIRLVEQAKGRLSADARALLSTDEEGAS
jgi:hypothetical protein